MHVVIDTYGARLSFDNGLLRIETMDEDGNMQLNEIPMLHITSLHLFPHVRVSTNVLNYCVNSGIPVFLENKLEVTGLLWSPRYGSIASIRKKQAIFSFSTLKFELIKKILRMKNESRHTWITRITTRKEIKSMLVLFQKQNMAVHILPEDEKKIRAWEAATSKKFFEIYKKLLPPSCPFEKRHHRGATDPVNALLNYGYGMLYKEVTKAVIHAGLDPYTGFFHRDQYKHPALVYDMVEPYRFWIESIVWEFCKQNPDSGRILEPGDQSIQKETRRRFVEKVTVFMHTKKVVRNGKRFTPAHHIRMDMQQLASYLQKLNYETLFNTLRYQ